MILCFGCATKPARLDTKARRDGFRRRGRAWCSDECRDAWVKSNRSARMATTNRQHASARMTARNPMAKQAARSKMTASLAGRPLAVRGGNGSGPTAAESMLAAALGWDLGVVVPLGERVPGRPTHYKLDVADQDRLLTVEVDGRSHRALERLAADGRKESELRRRGWRVFRVTNDEVLTDVAACAARITEWAGA